MNVEQMLTGDYAVIAGLLVLEQAKKDGDHELFSKLLCAMWEHVFGWLGKDEKARAPTVLLGLYMQHAGDTAKSLDQCEWAIVPLIGYERHQEAIRQLRGCVREHKGSILELLNKRK